MQKFVIAAFSAFVANAVNLSETEAPACDCPEMPACPMPEDDTCCSKIVNHYHYHYSCESEEPVEATLNPVCDPESIIYNETDPACVCDPNSDLYDETDLRCQIPFACYPSAEWIDDLTDFLSITHPSICADAICVSTS